MIIGKINDKVPIDDCVLREEEIETREGTYFDGYTHGIYKAQNIIDKQQKEIERLHKELDYANNDNIYYIAKIDKAIEYIENESWFCYKDNEEVIDRTPVEKLLEILKGDDKE